MKTIIIFAICFLAIASAIKISKADSRIIIGYNDLGGKTLVIINPVTGDALDVYGGSTDENARVFAWPPHYGSNQQWTFNKVKGGGGYYYLTNVKSGKVLAVAS